MHIVLIFHIENYVFLQSAKNQTGFHIENMIIC